MIDAIQLWRKHFGRVNGFHEPRLAAALVLQVALVIQAASYFLNAQYFVLEIVIPAASVGYSVLTVAIAGVAAIEKRKVAHNLNYLLKSHILWSLWVITSIITSLFFGLVNGDFIYFPVEERAIIVVLTAGVLLVMSLKFFEFPYEKWVIDDA